MCKMRKLIFLILIPAFSVQAETPNQDPDEPWFVYDNGYCLEKSPMQLMVFAQMGGVRVVTKDIEEKGTVVSTTVTLIGHRPSDRRSFHFYRGERRCEAARLAGEKKFEGMVDRYR